MLVSKWSIFDLKVDPHRSLPRIQGGLIVVGGRPSGAVCALNAEPLAIPTSAPDCSSPPFKFSLDPLRRHYQAR